ncbi:hypothetical protein FRC20_002836 [Serendipita sp. 405]|nr:hypothetical protein FRC20_002836 [Serendipita sp. 405]
MGQDLRRVGTLVILPPLIALTYITAFTIAGFTGLQIWLEHVGMAAGDATPWGWEADSEDWTGGSRGGTDPTLGVLPRFALRSAWFFQHWIGEIPSSGRSESPYFPTTLFGGADRGNQLAEQQIMWAMQYLVKVQKPIPPAVLLRHEEILEKLGTPAALNKAWNECLMLLSQAPRGSLEAAKLSLKLGNLAARRGLDDGAIRLWEEALKLTPSSISPGMTQTPTEIPVQQRHLADVYVQLSSIYASNENMGAARVIQSRGSDLIASFLDAPPSESPSPEERLHYLYLLHRQGVLSLQHAEVELTMNSDTSSTLEIFRKAARRARVIVDALGTGAMVSKEDFFSPSKMGNSEATAGTPISRTYSESKTLRIPGAALLRDARRTAMQAHLLEGALLEGMATAMEQKEQDESIRAALQLYQAALAWAGTTVQQGKNLGIPPSDIVDIQKRVDRLQAHIALQAS